jgi:hypothetical protein
LALKALAEGGRFLQSAALARAARRGLAACLARSEELEGVMARCHLLSGLAASGDRGLLESGERLAHGLRGLLRADGAVSERPSARGLGGDQDFMPGAVLAALADFAAAAKAPELVAGLAPQLRWYERRFELLRPWGMAGWQTQGWSAVHALSGRAEQARFVFELADWALARQSESTGAFVTSLHPAGPSFHTAFLLEGIAAAMRTAARAGDEARARRYREAWEKGLGFMDRLVIREDDAYCMAEPSRAIGGTRGSLSSSVVRIDYPAHHVLALVKGLEAGSSSRPARSRRARSGAGRLAAGPAR